MEPLPHQIEGARFLAWRKTALLADAPRVGKTGAALIAADTLDTMYVDRPATVITTASGVAVWRRAVAQWLGLRCLDWFRIVSWSMIDRQADDLCDGGPVLIVDESHYAKNLDAKRTQALYGRIARAYDRVWCLSGTPIPNAPNDLYPMLRALCPERLAESVIGPDVTDYRAFLDRYCVTRTKHLSRWKKIEVVVGGRNLDELKLRLAGFVLRRTQQDIGITAPIYDLLPVAISAAERRRVEAEVEDAADVLAAAETGETRTLEMHLGTLRRVTGSIKARGVARAVKDEFDCGLDRIVLMCWHRETMDALARELSTYGVVRVDGQTSPKARQEAQDRFSMESGARVFIGQILAAGEAIDLSAAAELIFAESSFVPKDMAQAALRITNVGQQRQPRVRVASLEGSIDEALQTILLRKVATNRQVIA